jgi:hypothetical protein
MTSSMVLAISQPYSVQAQAEGTMVQAHGDNLWLRGEITEAYLAEGMSV